MNIFSFAAHFGSEEACRYHFKEQRDKEGVTCKKCGNEDHYWNKINGVMNVSLVSLELHLGAEL